MAGLNPVGGSGPADVARLITAVRAPGEAPTPFRGNAPQQKRAKVALAVAKRRTPRYMKRKTLADLQALALSYIEVKDATKEDHAANTLTACINFEGGQGATKIGVPLINNNIIHACGLGRLHVIMLGAEHQLAPAAMVMNGYVAMSSGLLLNITGTMAFRRLTAANGVADPEALTLAMAVNRYEDVVAALTTNIDVPRVSFNDADLSYNTVHLLMPEDTPALRCLARRAIEQAITGEQLNTVCRSIMWVKTFTNMTAPATVKGGHDLLREQLTRSAVAPGIQPEVTQAEGPGGEVTGSAQALGPVNSLEHPPGALTAAGPPLARTAANVLRSWAMNVRDAPTQDSYVADVKFLGTGESLKKAVFACVLAYGIAKGSAPEGKLVADVIQAQTASASGTFAILNTPALRAKVSHMVTAIRENLSGWDAVMVIFAEHVVTEGSLDRPIISWLRTRLLNAGQVNVLTAMAEARVASQLIDAGFLPKVTAEIAKLSILFPQNNAQFVGVFHAGVPMDQYPTLGVICLYRNYQNASTQAMGGPRDPQLQLIRSQYDRIKGKAAVGEALLVLCYESMALDSAMAQQIREIFDFVFPGMERNSTEYRTYYNNILQDMREVKAGLATLSTAAMATARPGLRQ